VLRAALGALAVPVATAGQASAGMVGLMHLVAGVELEHVTS
jgi:hypothetical protein